MANRHLARSLVLQTLFEWDFADRDHGRVANILKRNAKEFAPNMGDITYPENLLEGIMKKRPELDEIIEEAATDWTIPKLDTIDRNALRIGLYELLFADRQEVPPKVAINEAIELAKNFGSDTSGGFVNGVLGAIYRELGEPGKDQTSDDADEDTDAVPYEEMPIEELGGAVVYASTQEGIQLALVHDVFGHWTLSKGKLKDGESPEEGTKREVNEEIGIDVEIIEELDDNEYIANYPQKGKTRKQVTYFLAEAKYQPLELGESEGLDDAEWFEVNEDILDLNFYDDILPIVSKAVKKLTREEHNN